MDLIINTEVCWRSLLFSARGLFILFGWSGWRVTVRLFAGVIAGKSRQVRVGRLFQCLNKRVFTGDLVVIFRLTVFVD